MKLNFNTWFYEYHQYLKNSRNGMIDFNDTKWKNINQRLMTLIELESESLINQPYGVISNEYGFDRLIELLDKSNYSFKDLDDSLVDTYRISYENAMSRMIVNTHTVIAHYSNLDKYHVNINQKNNKYYTVDVPFIQAHFGDRDEIIRQHLQKIYNHQNDYFIPMKDFISNEISNILGFTFICTVNGMICNDWSVAIDEKGFRFNIAWGKSSDVDFIIYKLDEAKIDKVNVPLSVIRNGFIDKHYLNITANNMNCIISIYNQNNKFSNEAVPNFGILKEDGLYINSLQSKTLKDLGDINGCDIIIYGLKFLFELPNTYPCVNFMDMMYSHPIVTENEADVYTYDEKKVVGMTYDTNNVFKPTTPPISIDRSADTSFKNVLNCLKLYNYMMNQEKSFLDLGRNINKYNTLNQFEFNQYIYNPANNLLIDLKNWYKMYMTGGIITSLITFTDQYIFQRFVNRMENFVNKLNETPTVACAKEYSLEEFYGNEYKNTVYRITKVFNHPSLKVFKDLDANEFTRNYFDEYDKNTRFTRPISEQSFITMRYSYDEECWVFTVPEIKHFHGIGNTFYIENESNKVFKFFIMYSDTEDPKNKNIEEFDFDTVIDFDKFSKEVDKYQGYIRYWNVENHLRKLSNILYSDDSTDKQLQVLSKVLTGKLNGEELLDLYPTDMNYEPSNASSDNISNYNETSVRAPFELNFLFYTIMLMYDNKDQLLSYFLRELTDKEFYNRYSDIDISSVLNETIISNYSQITSAPTTGTINSEFNTNIFYGIPGVFDSSGNNTTTDPYTYTFQRYNYDLPIIGMDGVINKEYYISNLGSYTIINYSNDVKLIKKMFKYISYIADFNNFIETRYTYSFDVCKQLSEIINKLHFYGEDITNFIQDNPLQLINSTTTSQFIDSINSYSDEIGNLITEINTLRTNTVGNIYNFIDVDFLQNFHKIYKSYGFDDYTIHRIKAMYNHLIKINDPMNLFEFDNWIKSIDIHVIKELYRVMADNKYNDPKPTNMFLTYANRLELFITSSSTFIDNIKYIYSQIEVSVKLNNFDQIISTCNLILSQLNKDLYTIESIDVTTSPTYSVKPRYIKAQISYTTIDGSTSTGNIILIPISEPDNGGYKITEIRQSCDYAFLDSTITPTSITVYDEDNNTLSSVSFNISLIKIGNMSDSTNDMEVLIDTMNTRLEFQNVHESSVPVNDSIVTNPIANLNFELLSGNKFKPLESTHEYILDRSSLLPGSIDVVSVPNSLINSFAKSNISNHDGIEYYVKPVQCIHNELDNGVLTSTGGKYHVNQTVYVKTNDSNNFVFPIIIKAIDHSESQGFVEAIVDYNNSKWFKIDSSELYDYTTSVECTVLDDNMCNFLNEFNNPDYVNYQLIPFKNNMHDDIYSLPGDPIYVDINSDYIHTRLNWIFGIDTPNRFIDETHKRYKFTYINSGAIIPNGSMTLFLLNHDFNTLTLPETYPILKNELNDHYVHADEKETYYSLLNIKKERLETLEHSLAIDKEAFFLATDINRKRELKMRIEDKELKIEYQKSFIRRLEDYINQPESPTTWFNLYAYDDAITYIDTGRVHTSYLPRIHDVIYSDDIEVRMYDWEHKCWLNPNDFTITSTVINKSTLDNPDDFVTDLVQYSLTITPIDPTFSSKKILVYFVYNTSDIYENITLNDPILNVRFKPIVSSYESDKTTIYDDTRIRKHYDMNEIYRIEETYSNDDFSLSTGYHVQRIRRSGKYTNASVSRWDNLVVKSNSNEYDYTDFDIYARFPFKNINQDQNTKSTTLSATINQSIDSLTANETITLICIDHSFDGCTSPILFTATTTASALTIIDSSIHPIPDGNYICTVAKDPMYKACGGVITVTVATTIDTNIIDDNHAWIKVQNPQYKIIPKEFILVPNGVSLTTPFTIEIHNNYIKDDDSSLSPYMYYYDKKYNVRYPISNIRYNAINERLTIDTSINTDVSKIKSNYIHVCRYSSQKIPKNGLIDFTGYIPTPLSRDRYEFWVNGRCLVDENLIIVSPTAIQLRNLTSLHNFELIELVDDVDSNPNVFPTGSVYMDLEGHTFSSYQLMMLSNARIRYQNIKYRFYFNTKSSLDTYTKNIIPNPNNKDIETDILSYIQLDDSVTSYNELYNIPSINGVDIYHPTTSDLGIIEIPHEKIEEVYDNVWSYEITMNPLFPMTHRDLLSSSEYVNINVYDEFRIVLTGICDKFFTVYITTSPNSNISDLTHAQKIIPMVKVGTTIMLDSTFRGMWVHTTFNDRSVQLK